MRGSIVVFLVFAVPAAAGADERADAAQKVRENLAVYAWDGTSLYENAVADLGSPKPAIRRAAGFYLDELLAALSQNEGIGPTPDFWLPYWREGPGTTAQEMRKAVASALSVGPPAKESLAAIRRLLFDERLPAAATSAARALARIEGDESGAMLREVLELPHPVEDALLVSLDEAGKRNPPGTDGALLSLALHHRQRVRDLARALLAARGVSAPPFDPARAFTVSLAGMLETVRGYPASPIPRDASFARVVPAGTGSSEIRGFLLPQAAEGTIRLLTVHLAEVEVPRDGAAVVPVSIDEEVERVSRIRASPGADAAFSEKGASSAEFEPHGLSAWEVTLAAWLHGRGDTSRAAAVLFPALSRVPDDRWTLDVARDVWGFVHFRAMLCAFAGDRDAERAGTIARHLASRFREYRYAPVAAKLARELEERAREGEDLRLPPEDEWIAISRELDRRETILWLCRRLVLLNAFQEVEAGDLSYEEAQFAEPRGMTDGAWCRREGKTLVINPLVELFRLDLAPAELAIVADSLADGSYIPTVSFWRDDYPGRTLHQVNWVVAALVSRVARRELVRVVDLASGDPTKVENAVRRVREWAEKNATTPLREILLSAVREARTWQDVEKVVPELAQRKIAEGAPLVLAWLDRPDSIDPIRAAALAAASLLDPDAAAARARDFSDHADPGLAAVAGLALHRAGEVETGLAATRTALARAGDRPLGLAPELEKAVRALVAEREENR
ncbi:MAG: hypothetical protein HY720_25710 [Planctomycetes bacterium]|nr:hypothetical protein [Planctomycetota bacterium]